MMVVRFDGTENKGDHSWVYYKRNPEYLDAVDTKDAKILVKEKDYRQLTKQESKQGGLKLVHPLSDFLSTTGTYIAFHTVHSPDQSHRSYYPILSTLPINPFY